MWLKRIPWLLAVVAIVAIFVTGRSTPRKYPDRIPVRFWHRWGGEWARIVEGFCDEFNKGQTKYEVIPLSTPSGGADTKFIMGIIGGDPPDVMSLWNGAIPQIGSQGLLTDLTTLMTPAERATFEHDSYPVIRQSGMLNGKVYGITIGSDLYALYVNCKHLREAGLDPDKFPKTLEGVMEWGDKLHKYDKNGNLTRLGFLMSSFDFCSYLYGNGFWDEEHKKLTLNTPSNLRCLEDMVAYRRKIGFDKVVRFNAGLNSGSDTGGWPFISGDLSITMDGQWRVEEIRKYAKNMDYRVYPIPPPAVDGREKGGYLTGNFMVIPSTAKQKEGAFEFVKFWSGLTHPERAAHIMNAGGWLPFGPQVVNTPDFQKWLKEGPQFRTFIDMLASPNMKPAPPIANLQFMFDQVQRAEDEATRGTISPKDALIKMEKAVNEELAKRRELGYPE